MRLGMLVLAAALAVLPLAGCTADQSTGDAAASTTPSATSTPSNPANKQFEIDVADKEVPCTGVAPMQCLQVRTDPNAPWELHYFGIDGFDYQPGYTYHLLVEERPWVNPPADAPSLTWHLVRVISKQPTS
ncbi:DUF4377 domain-containing protein [Nocardia sp. XZ_19_385]|uniref:DUF4377 domain-containing protein n=1 Tax=Nocardia sp. XZ_19_385 TaxID=2769488 RepID=UPI00188E0DFC|nr:DUF4377 domain-containing protein [Nocardia sp. XZ_19_385]